MLALAASEDTTHQHQGLRAGGRADVNAADENFQTLQTTHPAYLLLANRCTCRHPAAGAIVWSGCKATSRCTRSYHLTDQPHLPAQSLTVLWTERLTNIQSQHQRWCLTTCCVCLCRS